MQLWGWIDGCMDTRDGWMDRWMDGWMDGYVRMRLDGMDGWGGWIYGWINRWMVGDGWMMGVTK